jgi:hypothetical protein
LPEELAISVRSSRQIFEGKPEMMQGTYTKDKVISPSIFACNSSSRLRFKPTTNSIGFASFVFVFFVVIAAVVERRGRTGTAAKFGVKELLGFLLRRRGRPPEEEDPALEESLYSSSRRRRSSMMASFDIPFERSAGIVVVVGEASFAGIVMGDRKRGIEGGRRLCKAEQLRTINKKQKAGFRNKWYFREFIVGARDVKLLKQTTSEERHRTSKRTTFEPLKRHCYPGEPRLLQTFKPPVPLCIPVLEVLTKAQQQDEQRTACNQTTFQRNFLVVDDPECALKFSALA